MVKQRSTYVCQSCAFESLKWFGQCPECLGWNTFVETLVETRAKKNSFSKVGGNASKPIYLSNVTSKEIERVNVGIGEFDRVLGGGFVKGQVILLSGDPGIGKSTLLTQIAKHLESKKGVLIYVSGEESPSQIKIRADRMGYKAKNLIVIADTDIENVCRGIESVALEEKVNLIIVDSIQSLSSDELVSVAGSVGQVRLCSHRLSQVAKSLSIPMVLVGHVTKEGTVAGPKVLEHLVDTVLYLEGDSQHLFRVLKTTKNRFGPVSEVGIFEMSGKGLIEVKNPSKILLSFESSKVSGSCVAVVMEGYRPLLFEIQALTTRTSFGYPRRTTSGFSVNRLQVLIAILEKRCNLNLSSHDVFVNIAGGFKVTEYAVDLAVCLAVASSLKNTPLKKGIAAFGECGLLGEVRKVPHEAKRVKEAKKLGYNKVIGPTKYKFISQAIKKAFDK